MKTKDGYQIKKGNVYYWVSYWLGSCKIYKIRCRSFERLSGVVGITKRYYSNTTTIMIGTDDQDFAAPETKKFVYKNPELARRYCIGLLKKEINKMKTMLSNIEQIDLKQMKIEK
jgi:hypothetical protein